jgi:D-lactate dehydrogenase
VIVTGHQAFFTREALAAIAQTTLQNIADLKTGNPDPASGQGCHSDRTSHSGRGMSCR